MFFEKLFGHNRPAPPQTENVKLLATVYFPEEKAVIESLLRSAEIPYLARERGAGEVVRIVMGANFTIGCDIYVDVERYDEAMELISCDELSDELPEDGSEQL